MCKKSWFTLALMGLVMGGWSLQAQEVTRPKVSLGVMVDQAPQEGDHGGLAVRQVAPDSPAAKAGVHSGDVIVKADNKPVKDLDDLLNTLAKHKAGDQLPLEIRREGKDQKLTVTLGERAAQTRPRAEGLPGQRLPAFLGVQSQPLTPDLKNRLNLGANQGALVTEVVPDSPAAKAGLKVDDVITSVNGKAVANTLQLREAIRQAGVGKEVTLKVTRGQETKDLKAKLEEAPSDISLFPVPPGLRPEGFPPIGRAPFLGEEDHKKMQQLEKQVQDLQKRVQDLEKKLAGSGNKSGSK